MRNVRKKKDPEGPAFGFVRNGYNERFQMYQELPYS